MKNRDPWRDHPHLFLIFFKTCGLISMISHDLPTYFHHISPHFIASFQVVLSHHVGKSPITWLPYVAICCHDFPQLFHHISHSSHILLNFFSPFWFLKKLEFSAVFTSHPVTSATGSPRLWVFRPRCARPSCCCRPAGAARSPQRPGTTGRPKRRRSRAAETRLCSSRTKNICGTRVLNLDIRNDIQII